MADPNEYMFLDIEWNVPEHEEDIEKRDSLSIALIGTDSNLQIEKKYSTAVQPKYPDLITDRTCQLLHVSKEHILQYTKSEELVFSEIYTKFSAYRYIVVWNQGAYDQFQASVERAGYQNKRHQVIILQNVLSVIALRSENLISFSSALKCADIPFKNEYLHYAKHDVEYLYQLFVAVYETYTGHMSGVFGVVNHHSKILHTSDCRYSHEKTAEKSVGELLFKGYRTCKVCGAGNYWNLLDWKPQKKKKASRYISKKNIATLKMQKLNERNMQSYCNALGLRCTVAAGVIFISSPFSTWQIYLDEDDEKVVRVMHENYRAMDAKDTYHRQDVKLDNFYDVARYIYYHDKNFVNNLGRNNYMGR